MGSRSPICFASILNLKFCLFAETFIPFHFNIMASIRTDSPWEEAVDQLLNKVLFGVSFVSLVLLNMRTKNSFSKP